MKGIDRSTLEKENKQLYRDLEKKQAVYNQLGQEINDLVSSIRGIEHMISKYFSSKKQEPEDEEEEEESDSEDEEEEEEKPKPRKNKIPKDVKDAKKAVGKAIGVEEEDSEDQDDEW